jgi:hypothetical protein
MKACPDSVVNSFVCFSARKHARPSWYNDIVYCLFPLTERLGPHFVERFKLFQVFVAAALSSGSDASCMTLCTYSLMSPVKSYEHTTYFYITELYNRFLYY